jgi:glycosyltransferase involved in cell wall biosynthesis
MALQRALFITVDSDEMKKGISHISSVDVYVIQNGINITEINRIKELVKETNRTKYVSIRGMTPLYQIEKIVAERDALTQKQYIPLTFIYPSYEQKYRQQIRKDLKQEDSDIGWLNKIEMYELLLQSRLVFSIPWTDSSPRSVYEAIFCGCIVVISYQPYYDCLPVSMKKRIVVVNINKQGWLEEAIAYTKLELNEIFEPEIETIDNFDQIASMRKVFNLVEKKYDC